MQSLSSVPNQNPQRIPAFLLQLNSTNFPHSRQALIIGIVKWACLTIALWYGLVILDLLPRRKTLSLLFFYCQVT
jgi:hypothetical protein